LPRQPKGEAAVETLGSTEPGLLPELDEDAMISEMIRNTGPLLAALMVLSIALPGCLKTRAQLRGDSDGGGDSAPASDAPAASGAANPVRDVQPQGGYVVDELKSELTRLNGRIEDLERAQREAAA